MSPNEQRPDHNAWFVYSRRAGKFTAMPVSGKGWLAFVACLALTIFFGWAASRWASAIHPLLGFLALAAVIVIGVMLILRLAIAKGRPE